MSHDILEDDQIKWHPIKAIHFCEKVILIFMQLRKPLRYIDDGSI